MHAWVCECGLKKRFQQWMFSINISVQQRLYLQWEIVPDFSSCCNQRDYDHYYPQTRFGLYIEHPCLGLVYDSVYLRIFILAEYID